MTRYIVTDPAYILTDEQIEAGDFYCFPTEFGDGEYFDTDGNRYLSDTGRLAAIEVDTVTEAQRLNEAVAMGIAHIHELDDLLFCDCGTENGVIWFGCISIDTN